MHFIAWVRHSVRNHIIDCLRHKQFNHKHVLLQSEMNNKQYEEALYGISAPSIGPEESLLKQELRKEICQCLDILGSLPREILLRHYIEGVSLDELGAAYGLTANAVGQMLFRTRRKLKLIMHRKGIIKAENMYLPPPVKIANLAKRHQS